MALDIKGIAARGASLAFDLAGQVTKQVELRLISRGGTYNPATDSFTAGANETFPKISALFYQSREQKLAADSSSTGIFLVRGATLTETGIIGAVHDTDQVVDDTGQIWNVKQVEPDPAAATIRLYVSK